MHVASNRPSSTRTCAPRQSRGDDSRHVRNIRLRNALAATVSKAASTKYLPSGEILSIYDAAMKYRANGTPLVVTGGQRVWVRVRRAIGPRRDRNLLGVKAVIANRSSASTAAISSAWAVRYRWNTPTARIIRPTGLPAKRFFDISGFARSSSRA